MRGVSPDGAVPLWRRCFRAATDAILTVASLIGLLIGILLGWDDLDNDVLD